MSQVSIITPCYNASKFIEETIHSVLNQTFTDFEWIITDDCSKDNSLEILERYHDERIKIIKLDKNQGAANAYNTSIKHASNRYITFIDSDDVWKPEFLEEMLGFLINNKYELVYSSYSRYDVNMKPLLKDFKAKKIITFNSLLHTCTLSTLSSMYDSERVGKIYFPYDNKREDHSMWLTLLKKVKKGYPLDKTMSIYRIHQNSLSRNKLEMMKCQYELYRDFLSFHPIKASYYTLIWSINGIFKYSF